MNISYRCAMAVYFPLIAVMLSYGIAGAQSRSTPIQTLAIGARLTVRPHEMAVGVVTRQAGVHPLDSLGDFLVYVPPQCVGRRRVPLVVLLPGGGETSHFVLEEREHWVRQISDTYGMILLVANAATNDGTWDVLHGLPQLGGNETVERTAGGTIKIPAFVTNPDVRRIDAALKQVLRTYAIDPSKIALAGMSNGADYALFLGRSNQDVFSRIGAMSALVPFYGTGPQRPTTQFLVSGGIDEEGGSMVAQTLRVAQELREEKHSVETVLCLRGHVDYEPDYEYLWRWLAHSWNIPSAISHPLARPVADSDPVLTVDILQRMTTFWSHFMAEPDSIRDVARLATQSPSLIWVGDKRVTVVAVQMSALAASYPSVAADLAAAGLSAAQADADRAAIIRVELARQAADLVGPIPSASVLGRNLTFRATHDQEFTALAATEMLDTQ